MPSHQSQWTGLAIAFSALPSQQVSINSFCTPLKPFVKLRKREELNCFSVTVIRAS